jgi:hypothetical protein
LDKEINEYSKSAKSNHIWFVVLSTISYIIPLLIPIFVLVEFDTLIKIIVTSLAVIGSIISGVVTRLRLHENWINKRLTAFKLSKERSNYTMRIDDYDNNKYSPTHALNRLQKKCQTIIQDELAIWEKGARELAALNNNEANDVKN